MLGIINAFDVPARQPMVHELVKSKEDISNALALNSGMVNIARLVGPALSGIVLQAFGAGICFSINAFSFVAVIISLLLIKFPAFNPPAVKKKVMHELAEGFQYLKQTPQIGMIIMLLICMSLFVFPYDTVLPVFAKVVFKGNAATYGYISSVMGFGAVLGSLFLASLKKETNLTFVLLLSIVVLGVGLILFSHITNLPVAMIFAVLIGFGSLTPMTLSITLVQLESAPEMRGRVMSYVAMGFFGMLPPGSLLIGSVSQKITVQGAMLSQGIIAVIIACIFSRFLKKNEPVKKNATAL